jgi:ribosomal protein S18 acetylase RimI-like enzyme
MYLDQDQAPVMQLRRLKRADVPAYRAVRLEASLDPAFAMASSWFEDMSDSGIYQAFLMSPQHWVIGAFHQQQMLGVVHFDPAAVPHEYVLWGLYVMLKYRQSGIGEALVSTVVNVSQSLTARTVSLHVARDNLSAKRLYKRLDFVPQIDSAIPSQTDAALIGSMMAASTARENLDGPEMMVRYLQPDAAGSAG